MLFPENPDGRPEFWVSLKEQLRNESMCCVVIDGVGYPNASPSKIDEDQCQRLLRRMQSASICRISMNRGKAIGPHFAAKRIGETALVVELMTFASNGPQERLTEQLRRDLEIVAINLLYGGASVLAVKIPLQLDPWEMKDVRISSVAGELVFLRK